jgi:hypothetical protein
LTLKSSRSILLPPKPDVFPGGVLDTTLLPFQPTAARFFSPGDALASPCFLFPAAEFFLATTTADELVARFVLDETTLPPRPTSCFFFLAGEDEETPLRPGPSSSDELELELPLELEFDDEEELELELPLVLVLDEP